MFHPFLDAFPAFVACTVQFWITKCRCDCDFVACFRGFGYDGMAMKQHSTDNTIPTAADDAVDEADSAVAASKTTDETNG